MMQGIITAPILCAPELHEVIDRGFDNPANVELVSNYFRLRMATVLFIVHSTYMVQTNIYTQLLSKGKMSHLMADAHQSLRY